jgi:hypothetical protein
MRFLRFTLPGLRLAVAAALLAAAGGAVAQTDVTTSRINGTVRDATGAALPGVAVEGKNLETGLTINAVTDENGSYRLLNLPTARYSVTAKLQGFKTEVRPEIRLLLGSTPTVDFRLEVSGVAESVTVTGEVPAVEVGRTAASTTIQTEQVKALPLNGRNFTDLVLLTPTARKDTESRGTLVISGQRGINSNVAVDGADFNNPFFGGTVGAAEGRAPLAISQESIKEINVITNGASVEFGRSGGGVVSVITKSGTNALHGSAFYYWQPQDLIAAFADGRKPADQSKKQFGGSLGGPILKDRLFFFGSYERLRQDITIPVSSNVTDPAIGAKYPALASDPQFTQATTNPIVFGRLDWQAAESHRLTLRGNYTTYDGINGQSSSQNKASQNNAIEGLFTRSFVGQYSGQFGSSILDDLTLNYLNEDTPRADKGLNLPEVRVGSFTFGEYFAVPINSKVKRKQIGDTLTYLYKSHVAKIGFDYNDTSVSQVFKGGWRGIFFFSNTADLLAGKWNQYSQFGGLGGLTADQAGTASFGQKELAFFLQDQWYVSPTLTVTAGLRYERLDNPDFGVLNPRDPVTDGSCPGSIKNGCFRTSAHIPDDNKQWSPRIGASWSPDPKTVLRVALGRYFSRTPAILWASLLTTNGYVATNYQVSAPLVSGALQDPTNPACKTASGASCFDPIAAQYVGWGANFNPVGVERVPFSSGKIPFPSGRNLGVNSIDPDFRDPYTDRLTLDFEQEIVRSTSVGMNFTWAKGNHLQRLTDINLQYDRNADGSIKLSTTNGQPLYSSTRPFPYYGRITTSTSDGESKFLSVTMSAQRRFTNHFSLFASLTWSQDEDNDSNERNFSGIQAEDVNNLDGSYGYSNRDQKWRAGLNAVWETPLWGIGVAGSVAFSTGSPFNPTTGNDANNDTVTTGDRPTINGVHLARNSYRQPSFYTVSLRLSKTFAVGPVALEVFGECFNCTNTGNKSVLNSTYGTGQAPSATFGIPNGVGTPRTFQLAARVDF